jgi:hypothetical protein
MFLWLVASTALAGEPVTPFFGVEWRPFSRSDLVFVDEGRTSGTAVGEFDGTARPLFSAFGGLWFNKYVGMVFGAGMARLTSTSEADGVYVQTHQGVFRPSIDLRFGWAEQRLHRPVPWVLLGMYADLPSSRDVSDAYTTEEQTAADVSAAAQRARLGGFGGRLGFGVDYRLLPGISVGLQASAGLHRSMYEGDDGGWTSIWVATEAALLFTFEWPPELTESVKRRRALRGGEEAAAPAPASGLDHP